MAVFFIADTHFGHENVIKHCNRPFNNVEEMDKILQLNWNARVRDSDDVYIVGDFWFKGGDIEGAVKIAKNLKGRKHLIVGNHDWKYLNSSTPYKACFTAIHDIFEVKVDGERAILCHYPMAEWNGQHRGAWHIHGHIHNREDSATFEYMRTQDRALNAGVDITNYFPVTFEELKIYNQQFLTCEVMG